MVISIQHFHWPDLANQKLQWTLQGLFSKWMPIKSRSATMHSDKTWSTSFSYHVLHTIIIPCYQGTKENTENTSSTTVFRESLNFHVHVKLWQKKSWFLETSDTVVINGTLESYDCSIYRWDWVQVNNVIPINMRNTPFFHQTNKC